MTTASRCILIIEDEPQIRRVLRTLLELEQFRVIEAGSAGRGIAEARTHKPDLLFVDLGLPDRDGRTVIREVRSWSRVPIIVLSARTDESDKVEALEAGADDYLTKPFGPRELAARVQVALRHTAGGGVSGAAGAVVVIGAWSIDLAARTARSADGTELHLTPIEYRLLEVLAQHIGLVVTHRALLQQVWGPGSAQQRHYLRIYLKQLRAKLEPDPAQPQWLLTETGMGYRLVQKD
ncbi:MAG TPA: response regulator [Steroidobacteraceae bacterium]|jgi:two-component system KDP operon response regulator KdpE|nr:response regulator [Steroidobacteraceae bacterium]